MKRVCALVVAIVALASSPQISSASVIIDKIPDVGPYWNPIDAGGGTYVYANSFVFTGLTGTMMDTVGVYLRAEGGTGDSFRFEVYADNGNAPDPSNVLGVTGYQTASNAAVALVTDTLLAPISLTNGSRYWIAASVVGQPDTGGFYQIGGHTQNSIYPDNGTFWYSNDPSGIVFDGQALTPEMGIYAAGTAQAIPEPATLAVFGALALGAFGVRRRLKATA